MTRIAYLECPTGIAGDMCLGALLDAGVPLAYLTEQLAKLGIAEEYRLRSETVLRNGQRATKFHVELYTPQGFVEEVAGEDGPEFMAIHRANHPAESIAHSHSHAHAPHSHSHSHDPHSHSHSHDHPSHDYSHHASATAITTTATAHHPGGIRHLPEIEQMIRAAALPARAERWSLAVFRRLAEAEGAVHGIAPEAVHFHEVGAADAIVDIVGTCLGFDWLKVDRICCSALPTGAGMIRAAHGHLPVPAPAVLKLFELGQVPIYSNGIQRELVTPTGAAIAVALATQFGPPPAMVLQTVGLGAGHRDLPIPNMLRLWLGDQGNDTMLTTRKQAVTEMDGRSPDKLTGQETIAVLETQIDDVNPQAIGYLYDRLFAVGAIDVFTQAIAMKKSRPGILLTVLCTPEKIEICEQTIFQETTTLGVRRSLQQRTALWRELESVQTAYGMVRVKVARRYPHDLTPLNVQPEYEDCAAIAREQQIPWREVHRQALQSWYGRKL